MPVLNQVTAGDTYQTSAAILQDVFNSRGGWFSVGVNSAFVQLEYGVQGATYWTGEVEVGVGAFATLPDNCIGVQFRNAATGKPATITAQISQGQEPALAISALGTLSVSGATLNFQHNDVAVASEPTLDLEDVNGGVTWTVTDDAANTRIKLSAIVPDFLYGQITAPVNITGTTSGTSTPVITFAAQTFDGKTYWAEFGCPLVELPAVSGGQMTVALFDGGTLVAPLAILQNNAAAALWLPVTVKQRITPTAGSHTFSIQAWVSSTTGTPNVQAGSGSSGSESPAYLRFWRAA